MLLAGDAIIAIDNIEAPVEGDALCQTLTQTTRRIRPLGGPGMVTVPCAARLAPNGNNLVLRGDIVRRALVRRIDPQMDRPELRAFDQDLLAEGRERRGNLVADCHTIMAAYLQAGQPSQGVTPFGSFEEWSDLVRCAPIWAGTTDPRAVMERSRKDDLKRQALRAVPTAWRTTFASEPARAPMPSALRNMPPRCVKPSS
jgi:putative DNA primase/helicase